MKKTVLLLIVGCGLIWLIGKLWFSHSSGAQKPALNSKRWAALARGTVDVPGGLLQINSLREGLVESVAVVEGQKVATGEILAHLDERAAQLALQTATGELAEAESALPLAQIRLQAAERESRRLEALAASRLATTQEVETARDMAAETRAQLTSQQAAVTSQKNKVAAAQYECSLRTICSPVDGVVVQQKIKPGEAINTVNFSPIFAIAPTGPRIVRAEIEEDSLSAISVGQTAEIVDEMQTNPLAKARVQRIGLLFGTQKIADDDAAQKQDRHVVECILTLENDGSFLLGQRVLVRFLPQK